MWLDFLLRCTFVYCVLALGRTQCFILHGYPISKKLLTIPMQLAEYLFHPFLTELKCIFMAVAADKTNQSCKSALFYNLHSHSSD